MRGFPTTPDGYTASPGGTRRAVAAALRAALTEAREAAPSGTVGDPDALGRRAGATHQRVHR